jgi:hypothetical protein
MCIALLGLYYYLAGRREVDQLMHEAEEAADKQSSLEPAEEAAPARPDLRAVA